MSAPGPPVGADLTADIVIPMTIFFALGLVTSVARIWSRIWPEWVLRWDDYTLIFGLVGHNPFCLELFPPLFFSPLPPSGTI